MNKSGTIIAVGSRKGGTGKTTFAVNLALNLMKEGKTLLVDADPQGSSRDFIKWRKEQELDCPALYQLSGDLYEPLIDQSKLYDYIVVDTAGATSDETLSAILSADILATPVKVGMLDLQTLVKMNKIVGQAIAQGNKKLIAKAFLTHTPTNALMSDEREAKRILSQLPSFKHCKTSLKHRGAYWRATGAGLSVSESDDHKAAGEMENLIMEIMQ